MAVIKLTEPYAITQLRRDVRDSLMTNGEQAILLQLYHPGEDDSVPCPQCGDDLYKSPEMDCPSCYGTMFDGGVRKAMKVWAMFSDKPYTESHGPRGEFHPDAREVQLEAFPRVMEHDVVVRVDGWNATGTPSSVYGYYILQGVNQRSLRTGNRFGQSSFDIVAQKAQLTRLPESMKAITMYPILGQFFEASVQLTPATPTLPAALRAEPDTKIIYFPFEPAPGGVEPVEPGAPSGGTSDAFVFVQATPAATWTITHPLGYKPSVTVLVGGEEVEPDVAVPDTQVVVVTFSTPQAGEARLT